MDKIRNDLSLFHRAAFGLGDWRRDQNQTFINVGKYGLTIDGIAHAYLTNNQTMPVDLFQIFEGLAVALDMESDQELDSVKATNGE